MKKLLALFLALGLIMMATGCDSQPAASATPTPTPDTSEYQKLQTSFFGTFDTIVVLMGYVKEEDTFTRVTEEVYNRFVRYHQVFDAYNAYEGVQNLYALNQAAGKGPFTVEPELMDLLLYIQERQPMTEGAVNVALGAVLDVWHNYRDAGEADPEHADLPPMEKLTQALQHTDFSDVVIDKEAGTVELLDPLMKLDVGAVAKGYATEQVAGWLYTSDMPSFLISAGGNVRAGEHPLDGRSFWGVTIQDPRGDVFSGPEEDILDKLFVVDESVVTSGDYQRYYVVDGVRYHHIISPDTLMPADYFRSVTVVCEDSGLADMLSTAFFLLPLEEGKALADKLDGVHVFWMLNDEDGTIVLSEGMIARSFEVGGASSSHRLTDEEVKAVLAGAE